VSDPSGQNAFRLTSPDEYSASPRWSPDGRYIAFDSRARNNWGVYDLYVISVAGGEPHALTAGPVQNSRPSWSSDGRWIYFGSDRSGTLQIWKTPTAGGPARQVTRHGGSEAEESADGSRLYYSRRAVPGLWSVPVDGGEEVLVLKDLQWENSRNWTVTAEGIYFLYQEGERLSDRRYSLKLYRFRDKHVEQVASLGGNAISNRGCSISPNRRWLLYVQEEKSETDLAIVKGFR
jgi:dipeptidyl aminopeptidase/acylaminoacyl peptidase